MAVDEDVPLNLVEFDESGRAIISDPQTVARLRRALLREATASSDRHCDSRSADAAANAAANVAITAPNHVIKPEFASRIRGMTFQSPTLVRGIRLDAGDPARATAMLRFGPRHIFSLGPIVDSETPSDIRSQIEASDFGGQPSFGAKSYTSALRESKPVTRYVLTRLAAVCRELFSPGFDEHQLIVAVAVRDKAQYKQLQGAHIDWTKGAEFLEDEWQHRHPAGRGPNTLRSLEARHSVDCVLGGPPTEFFLDEQMATVHLHRNNDGRWIVSAIEFADSRLQPGFTGEVLFRPGYTIHQFPTAANWISASKLRLFVSCDYYCSRLTRGLPG
jgi:hypothetical protein